LSHSKKHQSSEMREKIGSEMLKSRAERKTVSESLSEKEKEKDMRRARQSASFPEAD